MYKCFILGVALFTGVCINSSAQTDADNFIADCVLKVDTFSYRFSQNYVRLKGDKHFTFSYSDPEKVCEIDVYPKSLLRIRSIQLLKSEDFTQLDSGVLLNNEYYRFRVRFANLNKSQLLSLIFQVNDSHTDRNYFEEIRLFPVTKTNVFFYPPTDELYVGEEKVFDLLTNNLDNIKITNEWTKDEDINYRLSIKNGQLRVHLLPGSVGNKALNLKVQTKALFLDGNRNLVSELPVISVPFRIKASRLTFLQFDQKEVTFDGQTRKEGVELSIENSRNLIIGKTYRVENQEKPGGALIAEIFTKNNLTNDRVLCIFRAYNEHRQTEGYLYIKDGDDAKFITNLNITPNTTINAIQLLRSGQEWTSNLNVFPGETVDIKIEGVGLHKARFQWEDVINNTSDTALRSENVCFFKLKIPLNINKRKINLFDAMKNTGYALNVKEYQVPRNFDYVQINYGAGKKVLSGSIPTVIYRNTIKDISISFDNNKIDSENRLYGRQYLDIDVRYIGEKGELLELRTLKSVLVCPGDNSPRFQYYLDKSAVNQDVNLNSVMGTKTYNLSDFSKVELTFRHQSERYSDPHFEKKIEVVVQRKTAFDIDVSFPAGLLIQNLGKTQTEKDKLVAYDADMVRYNAEHAAFVEAVEQRWDPNNEPKPEFSKAAPGKPQKAAFTDNLGGISLALIAQFSFPDANKVGKLKPYRLGAGFLAINAFNFSQSASRDLAVVGLATLYPIKPGRVFNLPIHIGFGYKFQDKISFIMLSPGIGVRF